MLELCPGAWGPELPHALCHIRAVLREEPSEVALNEALVPAIGLCLGLRFALWSSIFGASRGGEQHAWCGDGFVAMALEEGLRGCGRPISLIEEKIAADEPSLVLLELVPGDEFDRWLDVTPAAAGPDASLLPIDLMLEEADLALVLQDDDHPRDPGQLPANELEPPGCVWVWCRC